MINLIGDLIYYTWRLFIVSLQLGFWILLIIGGLIAVVWVIGLFGGDN